MSVAELEAEVQEYKLQLETVVAGLQADPDNAELKNLQTELEEFISLTESSIADLKPASHPAPSSPSRSLPQEKWSKENHPAFQPGFRRNGSSTQVPEEKDDHIPVYKVNDTVMAKWKSGDKAFYAARITSITGSSAKPVYIVTFKSYNNTETLFGHEIRPMQQYQTGQKRKAEDITTDTGGLTGPAQGPSVISPSLPAASGVISAASTVDPALATAARNGNDPANQREILDSGPKPPKVSKKISSQKALEGAKSKWQDFQSGGKGKLGKLGKKKGDSMFRTGEGVNAKVGFMGSGKAMRKDQARTRHVYDAGNDDEY